MSADNDTFFEDEQPHQAGSFRSMSIDCSADRLLPLAAPGCATSAVPPRPFLQRSRAMLDKKALRVLYEIRHNIWRPSVPPGQASLRDKEPEHRPGSLHTATL